MKKKIRALIFLLLGITTGILGVFMLFTGSKSAALIKSAVYLGEASGQLEYDGKLVIVTGQLSLLEAAADPELGITFKAAKVTRHAQNIKWQKNMEESQRAGEDMYCWSWSSLPSEDKTFYGQAMLGDYHLSEDLLEKLFTPAIYEEYDQAELEQAKLVLHEDSSYAQRYFLVDQDWRGPQNMGFFYPFPKVEEDYSHIKRYFYSTHLPEMRTEVTVIGVQNNDRLDLDETVAHHSFMTGRLNQTEVMRQFRSSNTAALLACLIISLASLSLGGITLIRRKR